MVDEQDVVDFATEMGIELATEGIAKTVIRRAIRYHGRHTEAFLEAGRREDRDREIRTTQGILARLSVLEQESEDKSAFLASVQAMVDDHQFWRVQLNLRYEAQREALDSRKKMLEAAAVGLADPSMSIEDKARVERALRHIDPLDIDLLKALFDATPPSPPYSVEVVRTTEKLATSNAMSRAALLTSGCVFPKGTQYGGTHYQVTELGQQVLRVLGVAMEERSD